MRRTYFYADPHFGHAAILEYAHRPFANIDAHDEALITRYAEAVGPDDTVIWCGDAFLCDRRYAERIMAQLPGHKILLLGNHDSSPGAMAMRGFDCIAEKLTMCIVGRDVLVQHWPYQGTLRHGKVDTRYGHLYAPRHKGCALVHGHTHARQRLDGTAIHVGVDAWAYRPVPLTAVEALIEKAFNVGRHK